MEKNSRISYLFASLTVVFWSTSATAFKFALRNLDYVQLLFLASGFSFIFYFVYLLVSRKLSLIRNLKLKDILFLSLMGFLNPFLYYLMIFKAYELLPAQVAQPLNFIWPIILVLLSVPLLGQKLHLKTIIALLISFVGVFFISSQGEFLSVKKSSTLGIVLALSSSVIWAAFWIFNIKRKLNEVVKLFVSFGFSFVYTLIFMAINGSSFQFDLNGTLASLYISLFEMGLAFILWMKALKYAEKTSKVSNFIYLVPFGAVLVVRLVLKEQIFFSTLIGILLILFGIFIQEYKAKSN